MLAKSINFVALLALSVTQTINAQTFEQVNEWRAKNNLPTLRDASLNNPSSIAPACQYNFSLLIEECANGIQFSCNYAMFINSSCSAAMSVIASNQALMSAKNKVPSKNYTPPPVRPYSTTQTIPQIPSGLSKYNEEVSNCNKQPGKVWRGGYCGNLSDAVTNYGIMK